MILTRGLDLLLLDLNHRVHQAFTVTFELSVSKVTELAANGHTQNY